MPIIDDAITAVLPLLSRESTDPKELKDVLVRLFREGVEPETLVAFIIEKHHERERLNLPVMPTVGDLEGFLNSLREPSPANRKRWEHRFKAGHAIYLCPDCGYAGNGDDFKTPDTGNVLCLTCGAFKHVRYFTRAWTPDEQAAYEAEQERLRPLRLAQEQREREKRQGALELEPKVDTVLQALEGVGDYVDEAEERNEVGPFVRGVVHATMLTADEIVNAWRQHAATHQLIAKFTRLSVHEFAARMILGEASMKEVLDNLDNYIPSELEPLTAGEERFFFTREEFIHEMTVNTARWQGLMDTRDLSTSLGLDGKFVITVHAKGWAEAHPCPCPDCKAMMESNPTKAGSNVA